MGSPGSTNPQCCTATAMVLVGVQNNDGWEGIQKSIIALGRCTALELQVIGCPLKNNLCHTPAFFSSLKDSQ